jgi:hypothetical protein
VSDVLRAADEVPPVPRVRSWLFTVPLMMLHAAASSRSRDAGYRERHGIQVRARRAALAVLARNHRGEFDRLYRAALAREEEAAAAREGGAA